MNHPVDLRVSEDGKHASIKLDPELTKVPSSPFLLIFREFHYGKPTLINSLSEGKSNICINFLD
jgi:hypothetical protein